MTARSKGLILALVLVVALVVIPIVAITSWNPPVSSIGGRTAIVLDIGGEMLEYHPSFSPGLMFGKRAMTLADYLTCIEEARLDPRVKALVLRMSPSAAGPAKCEELSAALGRFTNAGKLVVAFSPLLTNYEYLVACASDSIFMPPAGYLIVVGPASSAPFVRGSFDKLGIRPNIDRIGEYKSAAEMYTQTKHTPPAREMTERLLGHFYDEFVFGVAEGRGVGVDTVQAWIDRGLYDPERAFDEGLIDGVRYWDEIEKSFDDRNIDLIEAPEYMRARRSPGSLTGPRIAVIHAQGLITMGDSGFDPMNGLTMGSQSVIDELRGARENGNIKAVILRIDSPGGDGMAGDMISREVEVTTREKPVVVSMSDVAASGGYEIAYRANKIVAMPGTLTGSIGSITGKMNMRGLYNKLGVTKDEIGTGPMSLLYSDYSDFSDEEWKTVREEHWAFYRGWIREIARFRHMTEAEVDSLGRGRVWTGVEAERNGLIDAVGGLDRAVGVACKLAGISDSSRVVLVHYPRRVGLLQELLSRNILGDAIAYAIHDVLTRDESSLGRLFLEHRASDERIH
jgi:protease-4